MADKAGNAGGPAFIVLLGGGGFLSTGAMAQPLVKMIEKVGWEIHKRDSGRRLAYRKGDAVDKPVHQLSITVKYRTDRRPQPSELSRQRIPR